jgi:hypothetical protein
VVVGVEEVLMLVGVMAVVMVVNVLLLVGIDVGPGVVVVAELPRRFSMATLSAGNHLFAIFVSPAALG